MLGEESLYDSPTPGWKRLSVACQHTVTGSIAGRDRYGTAAVQYNIDFRPDVDLGNVVNLTSNRLIALQQRDEVKASMEHLRARLPYDISATTPGFADFRALMAVVSAAEAAGAARRHVTYSRSTAEYTTVPTGYREPRLGDLYVGPSLCRTAKEFVTFLKLAGQAGVTRVSILSDSTMTPEAVPLQGQGLAVFCARLRVHIQKEANLLTSYGAHELASIAGATQVMSLNGHSDEGGWLRTMLKGASFPPSSGVLVGTGTEFNGMPLQECIHKADILTKVTADYLSTVALAHVADVTINGSTSVYERSADDPAAINSYGTLAYDIDAVLTEWAVQICSRDGMHTDSVSDGSAFSRMFNRDMIDRHLETGTVIAPWWWIETAPLLTGRIDGYAVPAVHSEVTKLPMFKVVEASHDSPMLDSKGRLVHGATLAFTREPGAFRMEGSSYLFNSRYDSENSLSRFKFNGYGRTNASDLLFGNSEATDMSEVRWKVPHNPFPHPLEGLSDIPVGFDARQVNWATDPTPKDICAGEVESQLGLFYVVKETKNEKRVTYRTCPRELKRALKLASPHFQRLYRIEVKTGPHPVPKGPPPTTGNPKPLSDIESGDEDSVLSDPGPVVEKENPEEIAQPSVSEDDTAGEKDELPDKQVVKEKATPSDPLNRPKQPTTDKPEIVKKTGRKNDSEAPI